jgi:DNA polymerase elongation subunit (family B)
MLHRYVDDRGDHTEEVKFQPVLYIRDESRKDKSGWKDVTGKLDVGPLKLESMKEAKESVTSYSQAGILYGQPNFELQFLSTRYPDLVPGLHPKCRTTFIDIEVDSSRGFPDPERAAYEIDCICQWDTVDQKFYVFSLCGWDPSVSVLAKAIGQEGLDSVIFQKFEDEWRLLNAWVQHWKAKMPAILTGWNVTGFDMPYLHNRCLQILGESKVKELSPFNIVRTSNYTDDFGNEKIEIDVYGVCVLDLLDLYKKFTFKPRESYKLGYIGLVEIGEEKLDFEGSTSHADLRKRFPSRYVDYNVKDVWLTVQIDAKRKLIDLAAFIAQTAKINFTDVYSPVKTWDAIICNFLLDSKRVAKVMEPSHRKPFEGAYVKEVKAALNRWIVSFDVASLYPSIIWQWNMCPSTISSIESLPYGDYVDDMMNESVTMTPGITYTANGVAFETNKKGVLPELVEHFIKKRKTVKKEMIELKREREVILAELNRRGIKVDNDD